jgi:hypothetical protein
LWGNINYLLKLPHSCDFLAHCKPLIDFYGEEFQLSRNPFFLRITLDERPVTPRKGTNSVLIDGHVIEQHSDTAYAERSKELAIYNTKMKLIENSPSYWPRYLK